MVFFTDTGLSCLGIVLVLVLVLVLVPVLVPVLVILILILILILTVIVIVISNYNHGAAERRRCQALRADHGRDRGLQTTAESQPAIGHAKAWLE